MQALGIINIKVTKNMASIFGGTGESLAIDQGGAAFGFIGPMRYKPLGRIKFGPLDEVRLAG
jgi:hypothetical protein